MKHSKHVHHSEKKPPWKGLHQDWRVWVAVGLMLAAMGMYVLSLDDSVQPGSAAGDGPPAASDTSRPQK
jgi:hypothetical protein